MRWKTKSKIQNAISLLPSSISYSAYYFVQRHFGGLRTADPISRLQAGIATWKLLLEADYDPRNRIFFEVGTGRVPIVPFAYWLMGAEKTITLDLNPYMKPVLVKEFIEYIATNRNEMTQMFGNLLDEKRLERVIEFQKKSTFSIASFLELCQIEYIAPGDACDTALGEKCIDVHSSFAVLEHIPPSTLRNIFLEGNRIVRKDGIFIHYVDYSDHFSHSDNSISAINFLQYSDSEWERFAGNRYMYMNRLRHDDFQALLNSSDQDIRLVRTEADKRALELLRSINFSLDEKFIKKSEEVLSTTSAWFISKERNTPYDPAPSDNG